ncbi:MAG: DUF5819 family protein [Bacteroidota bacterium]|nr:DUF5819 family protein [Bacteroidota bacterium]
MSCGLFLLTVHFGSVFLYSKPFVSAKTKQEFYAQAYIYPYFHQNWNLFAPPPDANYKLYCTFENNGKQQLDLFSEIKTVHQSNRLKGYGSVLIALSNSIYLFEKNAAQKPLNGSMENNVSFKIIKHIAKNYLENTRNIQLSDLRLILVVNQIPTTKQRIYFN